MGCEFLDHRGEKNLTYHHISIFILVPNKYGHSVSIYGMHKVCEGLLNV